MRSTAGCAGATLARDVPFSALYWSGLEPIRKALLPANALPSQAQVMTANFVAGTVGGGLAAAVTTPLDVVKTRLQVPATSLTILKVLMCAHVCSSNNQLHTPGLLLQESSGETQHLSHHVRLDAFILCRHSGPCGCGVSKGLSGLRGHGAA